MQAGRWIRGVVIVGMVSAGCSKHDDAIRTMAVFDLLRAFPRATVQTPAANYVHPITEVDLAGDKRPVLFMHPASSAEFPPVDVTADSVLTFGIGIEAEAWEKSGDGVEFSVTVRTQNNAKTNVFTRYIDPKHNPLDRRWINVRIPLKPLAGQKIQITLATSPGPNGNTENDWAAWSEPQVMLGGQ